MKTPSVWIWAIAKIWYRNCVFAFWVGINRALLESRLCFYAQAGLLLDAVLLSVIARYCKHTSMSLRKPILWRNSTCASYLRIRVHESAYCRSFWLEMHFAYALFDTQSGPNVTKCMTVFSAYRGQQQHTTVCSRLPANYPPKWFHFPIRQTFAY